VRFCILADGIALGAATSVSQTGLTLIVFVAIMLHKVGAGAVAGVSMCSRYYLMCQVLFKNHYASEKTPGGRVFVKLG